MNIKFTSKDEKVTDLLRSFTQKHLQSIEKISGDIIDAEVIINKEKINFNVEIILKTRLHSYQIENHDPILKKALRNALNTLKLKAKKNKEKVKIEKKRKIKRQTMNELIPEGQIGQESPKITLSHAFSRKPMSVDEAIFFLKESGDNAYMFINVETNKMSVIFFNRKNEISIIEENK